MEKNESVEGWGGADKISVSTRDAKGQRPGCSRLRKEQAFSVFRRGSPLVEGRFLQLQQIYEGGGQVQSFIAFCEAGKKRPICVFNVQLRKKYTMPDLGEVKNK